MRVEEVQGLMEAYSKVYEAPEVLTHEEEVFATVANALLSQGYSAIDVLEYFSSADEEVIIEDVIALSEGTLIIESTVSEEYIEEQFQQLDEFVGAALRLGQAAVKGAQFAQKTGMLGRAAAGLRSAGTAATRMSQQGGAKASAVVRPALGKAVQNIKGAASGALQKVKGAVSGITQKVKGAAQGAASKVPGGSGGKLANAAKFVGKAALGGAAFEGGMRGVSAIANKLSGSKPATATGKPTQTKTPAAPAAARPSSGGGGAAPAAARPATTSAAKPTAKPSAPAKPAGSAMDQWAAANPKLAAAKAERDRTRGTSATTNPLMKDMKDKLPAPSSPSPSTAKTGFDLAKKNVNLAAGVDIFDLVKGHLLDEGYTDTEEGAIVMMANMSEEWRDSILEDYGVELN